MMLFSKWKRYVKLALLIFFLPIGAWVYYIVGGGNFATVEPGCIYRSAQPDIQDIKYYKSEYAIKSILNLRGAHKDADWYQDEIRVSKDLNIVHYDLGLSASHTLSNSQMQQLVDTLKSAPKPLLIHCFGGADRTGLACAIYEYAINKKSPEEAKKNLTILHGHIPLLWNGTIAMDKSFDAYVIQHSAKEER